MNFRQHSARLLYFIRWTSNHLHASKDVSAGRPDPERHEYHEYIVSPMRQRCKGLRQTTATVFGLEKDGCFQKH